MQSAFLELIEACRQHDLKHPDCQILSAYGIEVINWMDQVDNYRAAFYLKREPSTFQEYLP